MKILFKGIQCLLLIMITLLAIRKDGYAQCCQNLSSPNLVTGGGFEFSCSSTMPFSTDMTKSCTGAWPIGSNPNGVYNIGDGSIQSQWTGYPHSGQSYFVGDGLWGENNHSNRAWYQQVPVTAGKTYVFSVWYYIENLGGAIAIFADWNELSYVYAGGATGVWSQMCGTYTASTTGYIEIQVRKYGRLDPSYGGNDFGLDDISFREASDFNGTPQPDVTICLGASATLNAVANGGSGNYSYLWNTGQTTPQITVSPTATTTYSVIITDLNNHSGVDPCRFNDNMVVHVVDIKPNLGPDVGICPTGPTVITANPTGGSGNYSYLWNTMATTQSISVNYNQPGTYSVVVTDNVHGCTGTEEIVATASTCSGEKLYQNTSSLPTLSHYNNIRAGKNVNPSAPQGDVVVLNGQNVTFKAAHSITLQDGFTVQAGADFRAHIEGGCAPGDAFITKVNLDYCVYRLSANMEFGSGNYTYLWNTGATTRDIDVNPLSNTNYSVQIYDVCLGTSATANYNLAVHYHGGFSFMYPNLVTPNGDGYNDLWRLADGGKTQYAFNAYAFDLQIYNRWGGLVWHQTGTAPVNSTGFAQGDIYWNPNSPYVSDGVYYGYVSLTNCDQTSQVVQAGWIDVIRAVGRQGVYSDTASVAAQLLAEDRVTVSPNPTSGKITYHYQTDEDTELLIKVSDIYGGTMLVRSEHVSAASRTGELDLSAYRKGIYLIEFKSGKSTFVKKIILE